MGKKKKTKGKNNEIFDFNDEVVIGINSPKAIENKKKQNKKSELSKKTNHVRNEKDYNSNNKKNSQVKKSSNKKSGQKKNKNKNSKLKSFLKWTILILLLIGAIIFFLMSPLFNIKEITIEGESKVNENQIESLSTLTYGQNIFNFSKIKAKESIQTNPYIATVEIHRKLPNKVLIQVTERTPTYMIEVGNAYIYLDNQGYALELSNDKLDLPILSGLAVDISIFRPGDRLGKEDLIKLENIVSIVNIMKSNELYDKLISIDATDASNYVLKMTDDKTVYLGDTNNLNVKMLYLKKILESEQGIEGEIFLSGDNKEVFFREKI